jgi:signal transduction histidine kinase
MLLERWADPSLAIVPEAIDVAQLVEDVVSPVAEANPERTLRVDARPGPLVKIDPSDLTHALNNLIDNALKYTRGAIDVRVRPGPASVAIEIADNGPGMSPEEQGHAFDRFYRGNRREVDGSGLGLAIARRAIERAGGTLTLRSDPAAGSCFTITLPAVGAPAKNGGRAAQIVR